MSNLHSFSRLATSPKPHASEESVFNEERKQKPEQRSRPSLIWTLLAQFLGLLWLVPIITLLVFNFSSYKIGPSAWCPRGLCSADSLDNDAIGIAKKLDKDDHNTLGVLQFVAKALELWFGFVAINLIYNVVMWLANRNDGLPIGFLSASVEFADPRSLIDTFYAAKKSPFQRDKSGQPTSKPLIGFFVVFLVLMCLLVNIMGPATAVLVLPTLQWLDVDYRAQHTFRSLNISWGPAGDNVFPECFDGDLSNRSYSCTSNSYAASLDSWVELTLAGRSQSPPFINGSLLYGVSQEGDVLFTFNTTGKVIEIAWAPNRQVMRELSLDFDNFHDAYTANTDNIPNNTDPKYSPYTNSLQTILKRQGPVVGNYGNFYVPTSISEIQVGPDRNLRCFEDYSPNYLDFTDKSLYTKCIRVGTGWASSNTHANFTIEGSEGTETVHVNVYFSDKSASYNATYNPGLIPSACLVNRPASANGECPWEGIFDQRYIPPYLDALSSNILTIELAMPGLYSGKSLVYEAFTVVSYNSTYSLDTSPSSNPVSLVQVNNIPTLVDTHTQTVTVNPDWFLAAWSVDQDGVLAQNRSAAIGVVRGLKAVFADTAYNDTNLNADSPVVNSSSATTTSSATITTSESSSRSVPTGAIEVRRRDSVTDGASASPTLAPAAATTLLLSASNTVAITDETAYAAATSVGSSWAAPTTILTPDSAEQDEIPVDYYDEYEYDSFNKSADALIGFLRLSYLQALSMVDYSKDNITSSNETMVNSSHPQLHYYATVHLWMYGMTSRTSYFGVVVACIGIFCVVVSTVLGLLSRRRQRSLTEILIAAIHHEHQGELANVTEKPEHAARLRYKIEDDGTSEKIRFHHIG